MGASKALSSLLLGTALAFGAIPLSSVQGETPRKAANETDSIVAFWNMFSAAVIKGDKETVAALSRFPISRGYGMASVRNKAQFMKRYRDVFFNETDAAKCFPKAKPISDKARPKEFIVSCPFARGGGEEEPFEYRFILTRTGWKFTSFENINE